MPPLETAIRELRQILAGDYRAPEWRWNVRLRLSAVKDALSSPLSGHQEAWLAARARLSNRDRLQLQGRVSALATGVFDRLDTATILHEVQRLLGDLEHHVQREHDLVYDSVSLELGGSE
jgi:hypothetical protein